MDEIFRFVAIRPPRKAGKEKVIDAKKEVPDSEFISKLSKAKSGGERKSESRKFRKHREFLGDVTALAGPLPPIRKAITALDPSANVNLAELIKNATGTAPSSLLSDVHFKSDWRRLIQSTLAAYYDNSPESEEYLHLQHFLATAKLVMEYREYDKRIKAAEIHKALKGITLELASAPPQLEPGVKSVPKKTEPNPADSIEKETAHLCLMRDNLLKLHQQYRETRRKSSLDNDTDFCEHDAKEGASDTASDDTEMFQRLMSKTDIANSDFFKKKGFQVNDENIDDVINQLDGEIAALNKKLTIAEPKQRYTMYQGHLLKMKPKAEVTTSKMVTASPSSVPVQPPIPVSAGQARILGVGDLLVVREKTKKYELGEIAHIENVLLGESKERTHGRTQHTEETFFSSTDRETTSERDIQSTDRFELRNESSEIMKADARLEAGFNLSASYGPTVSVGANTSVNTGLSSETNETIASNYAHEVTERAANRVTERLKEERTRKVVEEITETNKHSVNNAGGSGHVIGIYRWVNKILRSRLLKYSNRLMLEFVIPEPSAQFLAALAGAPVNGLTVQMPDDDILFLDADEISESNYLGLAARYGVSDIAPPPPRYIRQAETFEFPHADSIVTSSATKKIPIKEGYKSYEIVFVRSLSRSSSEMRLKVIGGTGSATMFGGGTNEYKRTFSSEYVGEVPIGVTVATNRAIAVIVTVKCERLASVLTEWKIKTHGAILQGYRNMKTKFDEQMAASQIQQGNQIQGFSPERNRTIERTELKRNVISMLTGQHFELFDAINTATDGLPIIDFAEAIPEGTYAQFFENAFEWTNMSYVFYPYFWGRRTGWIEKITLDDTDPVHLSFLQAGSARVVAPVRPGYENVVIHYLDTGEIWGGERVPTLGSVSAPYVDITTEIREQQDAASDSEQLIDEWDVTLPTSLVMLQEKAELPVFG